jgi:hypothetical protein
MYAPGPTPTDPKQLGGYVRSELERIAREFTPPFVQLTVSHVAPDKPRDGMLIFADGTDLDPDGSGDPGFYGYHSGAWNRLG